ncbi:MAG: polyprenol monophosphomannose synthase [Oligoflexus sp.]|nr:polyprenol monophosphomannose synthase [Oligoflexus sp.]
MLVQFGLEVQFIPRPSVAKELILSEKSKFQAIVVIPTYNEALNIEGIINAAWASMPKLHILVVDDNSQDGTGDIIRRMQAKEEGNAKDGEGATGRLHLLSRAGKLGLGTAYIAGFEWALARGYQALVEMDADFSHDPKELPSLIRSLQDADVVIGSRYVVGGSTENWHFFRKLISRAGSLYARTILGMTVRDLTGGFNAWTAEALHKIGLKTIRSEGYSFQIELKYRAYRADLKLIEHPIVFSERREGQSKMSSRIVLEALLRVWSLRFQSELKSTDK